MAGSSGAASASTAAMDSPMGPDVVYKYEPTYRLKPTEDDK